MRFWITKNSELPVHEQLVRQVMLAILSEDLPAGHKLPSTRALARRYSIHANTVSAAYHDLLDRGWLELRRGSGMYVRPMHPSTPDADNNSFDLDMLLAGLLRDARSRGHEPKEVLQRLEQLVLPRNYTGITVIDHDPGMREILQAELAGHLSIPVEAIDPATLLSLPICDSRLVVALPTRAAGMRDRLPRGVPFLTLRLRSVGTSLVGHTRPAPETIVSIVSRSPEFRQWARAMLLAVGLHPDCLCDIDTSFDDWQQRAVAGSLLIADVVAARQLTAGVQANVFRVIADSCLAEIKQLCTDEI